MKYIAELVLIPEEAGGFTVWNPDLDIYTMGDDIADALDMGADAVHECLVDLAQRHQPIPEQLSAVYDMPEGAIHSYVVIYWSPDEPEREWMTGKEASDVLDVSPQRVSALAKEGKLRSKKVGRTLLVSTADVRERANRRAAAVTA